MQVFEVINETRFLLGEPKPYRFTNPGLMQQASLVCRTMGLDLDFPEATLPYPIKSGKQEYQLDTLSKILRVYIHTAGGSTIILYPTDIPILEGDLLQAYDNTSGTVMGAPIQSPQWLTQPPSSYPMPNVFVGGTVGTKFPYMNSSASNQRPCYYLRGGYIGILPPDIAEAGHTLLVDCIPTPPEVIAMHQTLIFPRTFLPAIAWGVVRLCRMSDQNAMFQLADAAYEKEMERLNLWRMNKLQQNKPKTFVPRTIRTDFRPTYGFDGGPGGWGWAGW